MIYKMGRRRPQRRAMEVRPTLPTFDPAQFPAPPTTFDFSGKALTSLRNIYDNDRLGDCVVAGILHLLGLATGQQGREVVATEAQVVALYGQDGGYVPGDPNTDNGCDEQVSLNNWEKSGAPIGGSKLLDWTGVDPTKPAVYKLLGWRFGGPFYGIELPDAWVNPDPQGDGFVWDAGTPDPNNGHCIVAVGATPQGTTVDTWGMFGTLTDAAHAGDVVAGAGGEMYVCPQRDWYDVNGMSPAGFSYADDSKLWQALTGRALPPISVGPTPPPPSTPDFTFTTRAIRPGRSLTLNFSKGLPAGTYNGYKAATIHAQEATRGLHISFNWPAVLVEIKTLIHTFGPMAVPFVERLVAKLPLTPDQLAQADALIEDVLGSQPVQAN